MHLKHAFVSTAIQIILCALRCVFFWLRQLHLNLLLAAAVLDDHNTTLAFWLLLVHNFLLLRLVVSSCSRCTLFFFSVEAFGMFSLDALLS